MIKIEEKQQAGKKVPTFLANAFLGGLFLTTLSMYIFLFGLHSHKTNKSSVKSDVLNEPKVAIFSFVEGDSEFTSVRQETIRQLRQDFYFFIFLRSTNE